MEEPIENPIEDKVWKTAHPYGGTVVLDEDAKQARRDYHHRCVQEMVNHTGPKIERVFRQAYCGSITLHDAKGEMLRAFRFGKLPDVDDPTRRYARQFCKGLRSVLDALRAKRPTMPTVFVADGAPELWGLMQEHFGDILRKPTTHQLIDFWHTSEYLGTAAAAMHRAGEVPENQLELWKHRLKHESDAAQGIVHELRESRLTVPKTKKKRSADAEANPVQAAIDYISKRTDRMNYASATSKNLSIGSGHVEATCKSLVAVRMKRPGSRWKLSTGDHIIKLRALALSGLWSGGVDRCLRTLRRPVKPVEGPTPMRRAA